MLAVNTYNTVTIFSSQKAEDDNEPDSDEDGQLDDNSESNEDVGNLEAAQNSSSEMD